MTEAAESIIFVVDGKGLEAMSLLLAASLARQHDPAEVQLIAYVSDTYAPNLDPATRALFRACRVRIDPLPSAEGMWKKAYPHGNKILACAAPRTSRRTTFLDTDMVCQAPITGIPSSDPHEVFAVPEGKPTWGKKGDAWERAYRFFDLAMPEERVKLTRGRMLEFVPYFNAGFVSFSDLPLAEDGRNFGALWLDHARRFDWECAVANKRPWLDQVTLPLTMASYGLNCLVLPEVFNYSISEREDLSAVQAAKMVHYHRPAYFNSLPHAADFLDLARAKVPATLQANLETLLEVFTQAPPPQDTAPEERDAVETVFPERFAAG
jgi:hypothetical protein